MTSQINPNNIDGNYPIAGQDNNSQGFRDNFTNTSDNFLYASQEITDIQNKGIFTTQLTGGPTLTNNMNYAPLQRAQIVGFSETVSAGGTQTAFVVEYLNGHYQTVTTGGNLSLSFTQWPPLSTSAQFGWVTLAITVTNASYTVTLPSTVNINTSGIPGLNTSTNVISFPATGTYTYTFSSINGGTSYAINQTNSATQPFNSSSDSVATGAACSLATATSYFTTAGTATLAAGVAGQTKVLAQTFAGSMVVTVANPAWGGAGTVTLNAQGAAVTLQYINSTWFCIGNNGATFA